jgi:hypothetical protein
VAADPLIGADGTADPPPPPLLPDPLAGLIPSFAEDIHVPEVVVPDLPELPDHTEIRAVLEGSRRPWPTQPPQVIREPQVANPPARPKPGLRGGAGVVIVIVLVTAVILYYVIQSLASTFTHLFG